MGIWYGMGFFDDDLICGTGGTHGAVFFVSGGLLYPTCPSCRVSYADRHGDLEGGVGTAPHARWNLTMFFSFPFLLGILKRCSLKGISWGFSTGYYAQRNMAFAGIPGALSFSFSVFLFGQCR
jgi:hypothetical protein